MGFIMKRTLATLLTVIWTLNVSAGEFDRYAITIFKGEKVDIKVMTAPKYGCSQQLNVDKSLESLTITHREAPKGIPCDFPINAASAVDVKIDNEWAMDYDMDLLVPQGAEVEIKYK